MTILSEFEYTRPKSLKEALKILAKEKGAIPLSGGTDIVPLLKDGRIVCTTIVDLKNIKRMDEIGLSRDKKYIVIGSLVTFSELIKSKLIQKHFPVLMEMAKTVASVAVRNRATLAGNICSAVPSMDSGSLLMALEANIHVESLKGKRVVSINKWFKAPRKTVLKRGEIVTSISLPLINKNKYAGAYLKLGRYQGEDLAQVSLTILSLPEKSYRIAFGAVSPIPIRASIIEKKFQGKDITEELLQEAKVCLEKIISPISDVRASEEYRMHMAKVMMERGLEVVKKRYHGEGPEYGVTHL